MASSRLRAALWCLAAALWALGALTATRPHNRWRAQLAQMHRRLNRNASQGALRIQADFSELRDCIPPGPPWRRIAGGVEALEGELPPWVGLEVEKRGNVVASCGGVLLTSNLVLTAAHCLDDSLGARLSTSLEQPARWDELGVQTIKAAFACTPAYYVRSRPPLYDWAVLVLEQPVLMGPSVHAACLFRQDEVSRERHLMLGGIGASGVQFNQFGEPYEVDPPRLKWHVARATDCRPQDEHESHLCTTEAGSSYVNGKACSGDSGSGLFGNFNQAYVVMGLVSYGPGYCGNYSNSYVVNAAVHRWADNIKDYASWCMHKYLHQRGRRPSPFRAAAWTPKPEPATESRS